MSSSQTNFFKPNSSKLKLNNVYPYDSFRPGNLIENNNRGKSSSPNSRINMQKDFLKSIKNNIHNNHFNSYNMSFKFNDTDKLLEEINSYKNEIHKKNKEIHSLKIAFVKLDEENKKNIRIIEEVIIEANRNKKDCFKFNPEDLENEIRNVLNYSTTSDKLLAKLLESHAVNSLKRQIYDYKQVLISKEEEYNTLKNNIRIAKYQELDGKLKSTIDELIHVKENYTILVNLFNEKDNKLKELNDEREIIRNTFSKLKYQNEEYKDRSLSMQEINQKLTDQIKSLEERNNSFKYQITTYKAQIKEKDIELTNLRQELKMTQNLKAEKEKNEKILKNLNLSLTALKDDLERKAKQIRDLQRLISESKQKCEVQETKSNYNQNNQKEYEFSTRDREKENEKQFDNKEKTIKNLEEENTKLRNEIIKLNDELIKKADLELANFEKAFNSKNSQININSNNILNERENKIDISQFEKNLEKELLSKDFDNDNKLTEISKRKTKDVELLDKSNKSNNKSKYYKNENESKSNHDNNRYFENEYENDNDHKDNEIYDDNIRNNLIGDIMKSQNESFAREENNFNYSDINKKDMISEENNDSFGRKENEIISQKTNKIKRPGNKTEIKEKIVKNDKFLIDEENRNLNSCSESNINNVIDNENKEFEAYEEYLKEMEELELKKEYFNRNSNKDHKNDSFEQKFSDNKSERKKENNEFIEKHKEKNHKEDSNVDNYGKINDSSELNENEKNLYDDFLNENVDNFE